MKKAVILFLVALLILQMGVPSPIAAQQAPVKLRDIGKIVEDRDNQLMGYGVVVGLRNTGDSRNAGLTGRALGNLLGKLGVPVGGRGFNTRNVASVMVTAILPPFLKPGQKIPVVVSAMGDSTSLLGGTLLMTPLRGPDMRTYAVAQGSVIVGGMLEESSQSRFIKNQTTVGRIPDGAIIETEVPVTFQDQHNITIVLNESNFITVSRATESIRESGFPGAQAIDANTIKIPLADLDSSDLIQTIARLEDVEVMPDSSAKVVINSRTGTVVIGERVRLFPVAMTHGNISVKITENAGGINLANDQGGAEDIEITEGSNKIVLLNPTATLTSLVNALNEIGATPKDLISIIQGLQQSGSLVAEVEIL